MNIKADFIRDNHLKGVIIWEMSGNIMDENTTPLLVILTLLQ